MLLFHLFQHTDFLKLTNGHFLITWFTKVYIIFSDPIKPLDEHNSTLISKILNQFLGHVVGGYWGYGASLGYRPSYRQEDVEISLQLQILCFNSLLI